MNIWTDFLKAYGPALIYTVVMAIVGLLARAVAKIYNKHVNTQEKRAVAKSAVLFVEQVYKDLHGAEKFSMALEYLLQILTEKGIPITEVEARVLIEAAVGEFNNVFNENVEPLPAAAEEATE